MTDPLPPVVEDPACPHIVTSDEGTSFCDLAENRVRELTGLLAKSEQRYRVSLDARADLEQDNEGLSRHMAFMERYRMRATRLGVEAEALLDAVVDRLDQETGDTATPDSFHEGLVDGLTRVIAHPAAVRLRALLDDPPTPEPDQHDAALRVIRRYADGWHPVWTTVTDGTKAEWWRAVWDADDEIEPIPDDERAVIEAARALGGHPSGDSE